MSGWRRDMWLARLGRWVDRKRGRPFAGDLGYWDVGAYMFIGDDTGRVFEIVHVWHTSTGTTVGLRNGAGVIADWQVPIAAPIRYGEPELEETE